MSIHSSDPFATPEPARSPVRRLRGRLPAAVTLWTAYDRDGRPAGLTVSSTVVVDGEPGRLLGLIDEESDLWTALGHRGRFAVVPLGKADHLLADQFAGRLPAPGGPFKGRRWQEHDHGPVLDGAAAWAGCRLDETRRLGWGVLVEATIETIEIQDESWAPLVHYRGRYASLQVR